MRGMSDDRWLGEYEALFGRCPRDVHGRVTYRAMRGEHGFDPGHPALCFHYPFDPLFADVSWPGDAPFAAWASHDVDWFWLPRIRLYEARRHLQNRSLLGAARMVLGRDRSRLERVADLDESLGIRSTFFLMANEYGLSSSVLEDLVRRGFEVGLHGSYRSYLDRSLLVDEKRCLSDLGVDVRGVRQHFLRFDYPGTWAAQSGIFDYDSTYGWIDQIGYRSSCCTPFVVPRLQSPRLLEIPLAVQDVTVFEIAPVDFASLKSLVNVVAARGGLFSYLWHNGSLAPGMASRPWDPWGTTYVDLTRYLKEKGAVFLTGADLAGMEW